MFPTRVPIIMPQLGESIAEATIVSISVKAGDHVAADQEIIEVETNKALLQVTTPCAGEIVELTAEEKETYAVGATLGFIQAVLEEIERLGLAPTEVGGDDTMPEVEPGQPSPSDAGGEDTPVPVPRLPAARPALTVTGGLPVPAALAGAGYHSPRVRARLGELGLQAADLAGLAGTGANGRVTVGDLEKFLGELDARKTEPAPAMRVAVGDAMRRSWSRPLATVGRPARLDALLAHRKGQSEPKPGMALYVIRAFALALAEDRSAASRMIGKRIVPAASIDIGFAVEVEGGLMVPVLRGADLESLTELNVRYHELVAAARRRQVPADAVGNAAGTVTNFGPFGLTWATPLPLPDENLMLGIGAGQRVPSWVEEKGAFVPVTEAEITLSFDHRSLDGGGARQATGARGAVVGGAGEAVDPPPAEAMAMSKWKLFIVALVVTTCLLLGFFFANRPRYRPTNFRPLAKGIVFTSQLAPVNMGYLVRRRIRAVVDLRPDGESSDQASSAEMKHAADEAGVQFYYIPVPHDRIPSEAVEKLSDTLAKHEETTLLYCRTGNRAVRTFALVEASRQGRSDR